MEQKEISDFTDVELKALAYDQIGRIETAKQQLGLINQELEKRAKTVLRSVENPDTVADTVEDKKDD